jgi:hypothetical protein
MQRRSDHYAEAVKTIEQDGEDYPASVMLLQTFGISRSCLAPCVG